MLNKALKIQQEKEVFELSKLQDKVTKLQNSLEEKKIEITSLKENLAKYKKDKERAGKKLMTMV